MRLYVVYLQYCSGI